MAYVIPAPIQATLPVVGSDDQFPIHRIYCVGRNYAAHAREMGHDPDREEPFFFMLFICFFFKIFLNSSSSFIFV